MSEPVVIAENIEKSFGPQKVHRGVSLTVHKGESLTFLGPSGCGKTVMLKMIIGLLKPDAGTLTVLGENISTYEEERLLQFRSRLGMLFQGAALFDSITVGENVSYPLRESGITNNDEIKERVNQLLGLVGLPEVAHKFPNELSGGQKKRIGLARALARRPEIVLFDEPTTGLDPTATRLIDELIIKLRTDLGITTITVTHDIASAKRISTRFILFNQGRVVADQPNDMKDIKDELLDQFVSGNWKD